MQCVIGTGLVPIGGIARKQKESTMLFQSNRNYESMPIAYVMLSEGEHPGYEVAEISQALKDNDDLRIDVINVLPEPKGKLKRPPCRGSRCKFHTHGEDEPCTQVEPVEAVE